MSFHGMGSGEGGENFLVMVESSEGTRGGVEDEKTFYLFIWVGMPRQIFLKLKINR